MAANSTQLVRWYTIFETRHLVDLEAIKLALNQADIPFRVLDEHSLRIGSTYMLGGGGARVQVDISVVPQANGLLKALGFRTDVETAESKVGTAFRTTTDQIPLLNTMDIPFRILFIVFVLTLLFFTILWWITG